MRANRICDTAFVPKIYKSSHDLRVKYNDPIQNDRITPQRYVVCLLSLLALKIIAVVKLY